MKMFRNFAAAVSALVLLGFAAYAAGTTVIGTNLQINNQIGQTSYTFLCTPPDAGKVVEFGSNSSIAVTLPQAGATCFAAGWFAFIANQGSGTITVTPATSTIASATTLAVPYASTYQIISDGTNYLVIK